MKNQLQKEREMQEKALKKEKTEEKEHDKKA